MEEFSFTGLVFIYKSLRRRVEAFSYSFGGVEGDRTPDLVIANDALSQLSYDPIHVPSLSAGEQESSMGRAGAQDLDRAAKRDARPSRGPAQGLNSGA